MMDITKGPGILCQNIILVGLKFSRIPNMPTEPKYNVDIKTTPTFSDDKKKLQMVMQVSLTEESGALEAICTMVGHFLCVPECENLSLSDFAKANAPAIIYPYCREIISNTTLRAGINPVILPPFNFVARASKCDEKPNETKEE